MAVPAHKDDLRAAIERSFEALVSELRAVPRSYVRRASLDGHAKGSLMSTSDLVAYLIGWNTLVLKWLDCSSAGRAIEFPETGYKWNQLVNWRKSSMPITQIWTIPICYRLWTLRKSGL
jgi:hypothetical protein